VPPNISDSAKYASVVNTKLRPNKRTRRR
jgi:hypothetical protein